MVDKLGADTFSAKALDLVSRDGEATGRPERRLGPAADLPQGPVRQGRARSPGDARGRDGGRREARRRRDGRHHAGHQRPATASPPRRSSTSRWRSAASWSNDAGDVTLDSPECVDALTWYRDIAKNYSVAGSAGRRLHPRHVLRRPRGDDVLVAVPARRHGGAARRHQALVQGVQEEPGVPGREQRAHRPDRRPGRRAEPVRRRLDGQHLASTRRPRTRRRSRVHAVRRLRRLARASRRRASTRSAPATARTRRSSRRRGRSSRAASTRRPR